MAWLAPLPVSADESHGAQSASQYRVDPFWPKQLPNQWIMGQVGGLTVDTKDHVWVLQRPRSATPDELWAGMKPPQGACCVQTPAVIEFDSEGTALRGWGGPGLVPDWPEKEHGIWVDRQGNVWLGGSGPRDRHILKFTADGKPLLRIGRNAGAPKNNQAPADISIDESAGEVYIADGYLNNRVVVYDSETGAFKRGWGAYGIPLQQVTNEVAAGGEGLITPVTDAKQFSNPVHCVRLSTDGLVYVCDRSNNRIQVFDKQGKFQKQFVVQPETRGIGSVWTVSFSPDAGQEHLLVADGTNNVVWVLRREDGAVLSSFGHHGRNAGQFHWVHQAASDSKGNLYTGEVDTAKRVQKFVLRSK
jgi:DNA-binding beta-propeller fold protein YncE